MSKEPEKLSPVRAIFKEAFGLSSIGRRVGWHATPSDEPQTFPREFIDAAVAAGRATRVPVKARAETTETPAESKADETPRE